MTGSWKNQADGSPSKADDAIGFRIRQRPQQDSVNDDKRRSLEKRANRVTRFRHETSVSQGLFKASSPSFRHSQYGSTIKLHCSAAARMCTRRSGSASGRSAVISGASSAHVCHVDRLEDRPTETLVDDRDRIDRCAHRLDLRRARGSDENLDHRGRIVQWTGWNGWAGRGEREKSST